MGEEHGDLAQNDDLVHTTFIQVAKGYDKAYIVAESTNELKKALEDKLAEYNEIKSQMNLVLFKDAMLHVCKIARMLDFPIGNVLLIGVGGSGK